MLDASAAVRLILGDPAAAGLDPQQLLADGRDLVDHIEPDRHLQVEALARREAAALFTTDQRLQQLAVRVLP